MNTFMYLLNIKCDLETYIEIHTSSLLYTFLLALCTLIPYHRYCRIVSLTDPGTSIRHAPRSVGFEMSV